MWRAGVTLAATWAAALVALTPPAAWAVLGLVTSARQQRLAAYWLLLLAGALPAIAHVQQRQTLAGIIVRKLYHFLAVALFLPALAADPSFLLISLAIALAALLLLEAIRVGRIPPLGAGLHVYMNHFTDYRDIGPVITTHFALLLGVAVPLWVGWQAQGAVAYAHVASHMDATWNPLPAVAWDWGRRGEGGMGVGGTAWEGQGQASGQLPHVQYVLGKVAAPWCAFTRGCDHVCWLVGTCMPPPDVANCRAAPPGSSLEAAGQLPTAAGARGSGLACGDAVVGRPQAVQHDSMTAQHDSVLRAPNKVQC